MQRENSDGRLDLLTGKLVSDLHSEMHQRLIDDPGSNTNRHNLRLLEVDLGLCSSDVVESTGHQGHRIAIVSLLFNWPSTGGGIVHTAELAKFLTLAGYEVCHFYAEYPSWKIGEVSELLDYRSKSIRFSDAEWSSQSIRRKFQSAVDSFSPDCVIVTDSWNTKLVLAEAVAEYPYFLRLAAMECLCPLNNVRLLCDEKAHPKQCTLTQLTSRDACLDCVSSHTSSSGGLHFAERELAGFTDSDYGKRLLNAFQSAEGALVVNSQIASLVEPFVRSVHVIPSGFDVDRFSGLPIRDSTELPFRILFAGLVNEYMKGFHVLLDACRKLWGIRRDFELWVTANDNLPADPFLRPCGWQNQSELPHLMAQCDVVAVPTVAQEALGRTAVEAMGACRAVIASRLGGLKEVVSDGLTGLLVTPADSQDLVRGLIELMDDRELTEQYGKNGRRRFEKAFPWSVIIDQHYRALFEACRRKK